MVVNLFLLIKFNYSNLSFAHSNLSSSASFKTLNDRISTFKGITAYIPYIKE
jgi:hypothetical protein